MTASFSELGISDKVVKAMEDMGWTEPTPVQVEAIPEGLKGKDIIAQAQTGTGKTGAFGSIILDRIEAKGGWANALILTPTRELAIQIEEEFEKLSKYTGHKCVTVYGGVSMVNQTKAMDKGVDIIVATPGRLCDHLKDDEQLLDDVSLVVLDEADRMLDMGFKKDLEFILHKVPGDRQMMMFTATMPPEIRELAVKHLDEPKEICVSKDEVVLDLITQRYMDVEKDDKVEMLRYVLANEPMKTIVFCYTKYRVDKVVRKLKMSFKLAGLHSEYTQNKREEVLEKFKNDEIQVLVATDIAARGLDIDNVMRVINLDLPAEADTYVHRIGRTGRAGKQGLALSFVMHDEKRMMREIENLTLIPIERMETPSEEEVSRVCGNIKTLSRPVMAKKNSRPNDVPVEEKEFVLAEINIGKEDQQNKASIAQLLRDYTDVPKKSVGNIMPGEKTSTLEIEKKYLDRAAEGMQRCTVNGRTVKVWKVADIEKDITEDLEQSGAKMDDGRPRYHSRPKETRDEGSKRDYRSKDGRSEGHYGKRDHRSEGGSDFRCDRQRRSYDGGRSDRYGSRDERPRRSYDNDRPRDSYGDRPKRDYRSREDRPRDSYGDRPRRQYGEDRPRRSYDNDRPRDSYGDRPKRDYRSREDRPRDSYGDRPRRSYDNDRPKREYRSRDDRPRRSYDNDRPRSYGDRPRRSYDGERDLRSGSDRPKRQYQRKRDY